LAFSLSLKRMAKTAQAQLFATAETIITEGSWKYDFSWTTVLEVMIKSNHHAGALFR